MVKRRRSEAETRAPSRINESAALGAKKKKRPSKVIDASGQKPSSAGTPGSSDDRTPRLQLAILVLTVFVGALALRLLFVKEVELHAACLYDDLRTAPKAGFLASPDSDAYLSLARTFFSSYFGDQAGADALWRTPGYPALLIPFTSFGLAPAGILSTQAVLGALIPVLTLLLAQVLTGNLFLAGLAGLLSMISPTGVGLSGLIMNDLLMGFLVAAGVGLLYLGSAREKASWLVLAGVLFGIGFLVKPILTLWPLGMVAIHYLLCVAEGKRPHWKAVGVAVAIQILIVGLWCTRNYLYERVFSPSSNINFAMHDYLRPRVEEWVKAGRLPTNQAVRRNRDEARAKLEQQNASSSLAERLDLMRVRSMEVLRAHPWATVQVVWQDMKEHALSGWDYFAHQLPLGPEQVKRLNQAARWESGFREKALIVTAGFFVLLLMAMGIKPTAAKRRLLSLMFAFTLIYAYFSVFSGTAFWGGSRIMYPVEFVMIILLILVLQGIGMAVGYMLERLALSPAALWSWRSMLHRYGPWAATLLVLGTGVYGAWMIADRDSGTYDRLGRALASRGNLEEAIPSFQKAVRRDPGNFQAKHDLALAHLRLEQYGEAVPLLREVLSFNPGDADSNYLLGLALAKSGMSQEGLKHLQEALRLNPGHEKARNALSTLANPSPSGP